MSAIGILSFQYEKQRALVEKLTEDGIAHKRKAEVDLMGILKESISESEAQGICEGVLKEAQAFMAELDKEVIKLEELHLRLFGLALGTN